MADPDGPAPFAELLFGPLRPDCDGIAVMGFCLKIKKIVPKVCSGGGFGYAGREWEFKVFGKEVGAEAVGVVGYDSKEGGAHGTVWAAGAGPFSGGYEFSRTWRDWKEHREPIVFAGGDKHIHGIGGIKFDGKAQGGGLFQYSHGILTIGGYGGFERATYTGGGGGYLNLSWINCGQAGTE